MNDWENAELHAERAYHYYEAGQWDKALGELQRALEVNPDQSEWHFGMGLTLDAMERYAEAAACFARVLRLRGEDVETMLHLAIDLIHCQRHRKAIKILKRITKLDPDYEPAWCYQILAYARLAQHEQAEQAFYMARQIVDQCPLCYDHIAESLAGGGKYDRAIWCWKQVGKIDPNFPDVHANLGRAYWAAGDFQRARRQFQRQLKSAPGDTQTLMDLGNILMEIGRYTEAGEKFRRALEMDPTLSQAHLYLGELALATDHLDAAEAQLRTADTLGPKQPGIHLRLAQVARRRGDQQGAVSHLRRELGRKQEHPDQALELAGVLVDMHMSQPAIELLSPLINQGKTGNPPSSDQLATAHLYRGVAQLITGATAAGAADCRKAVRTLPRNTVAMHNLVLAYLDLRRLANAWYWYRRLAGVGTPSASLRMLRLRLWRAAWSRQCRRLFARLHPGVGRVKE